MQQGSNSQQTAHQGGKKEGSPVTVKDEDQTHVPPAEGWEWVDKGHPDYNKHRGPGWKMPMSDVVP